MTAPNFVFGMVIATLLGVLFHLWRDGGLGKLLFYILVSWFGFAVGQVVGGWMNVQFLSIGALHLATAVPGSVCDLVDRSLVGAD